MNALTQHFHRAQNLIQSDTLSHKPAAQKAVAPFFTESGTGDSWFYEIPAYLRANLNKSDQHNLRRAADYAERVRVHVQGEVA